MQWESISTYFRLHFVRPGLKASYEVIRVCRGCICLLNIADNQDDLAIVYNQPHWNTLFDPACEVHDTVLEVVTHIDGRLARCRACAG